MPAVHTYQDPYAIDPGEVRERRVNAIRIFQRWCERQDTYRELTDLEWCEYTWSFVRLKEIDL